MFFINHHLILQSENRRKVGVLISFLALLFIAGCATQPADIVLNSDRIRDKFGSYGVDILYADERKRISSLYSESSTGKTTRTFAVVDFQAPVPQALEREHSRVTSGQTIGEVFRASGWHIEKLHLYIGNLDTTIEDQRIAELMRIALPPVLAGHVYAFVVTRNQQRLTYATIIEVHHPEFLSAETLQQIYGEILIDDSGRTGISDFVSFPDHW